MINTSNEYKKYIADSVDSTLSRNFRAKADITLADGTVLTITEEDIVVGGLEINDATSISNSFQIGSAIINQCTLMLNNIGGKFDQYDFTDAIIRPYIGLELSETTEWLKKGVFTVDEPTVASSIISLVALDNMNKFDTPFSDVTISFPCTQLQLLQAVCLHCGVSITNATFTNSDFIVTRRPDDEATTCREIVAWIAQNSGNFARCNTDGVLELKWYDTGAFEQADSLDGGAFDGQTTDELYGLPEGTMESAGRNLLRGTSNEWKQGSIPLDGWYSSLYELLYLEDYGLEAGDEVVLSMEFRTTSAIGIRSRFEAYLDINNRNTSVGNIISNGSGKSIITVTIPINRPRFRVMVAPGISPAPEKIDYEYRFVKLEKTTPWLEEQIALEGRNLLKKTTSTFQTVNHNQYFANVSGTLHLKDYGFSVGEMLTASVYVKTTSIARAWIRFRWLTNNGASNHANDFGTILEKNSEGMLVLTSKIPAQTDAFQIVINAEDNDTNEGTFEYKLLKLEKGSSATPWNPALEEVIPWTPAPEDVSLYQSGDNADGGDFTYTEQTHYDGGTFKQAEKYHHIYALNQATIGTDDVIITGIQVKAQGTQSDYGETVLFGNKGYVIEITNPLITENTASIIANSVGAKIVGMRFRPCDISALSDPSREAGDVAYLSHKGSTYQILLTNVSYQIGGSDSISCDAETPSRKQSVRFDASTKAIVEAKNIAKQEITNYDLEQQRFNNLVFHSFGLYRTDKLLEDGSTIEYAHDKPTLAESINIWRQSANTFAVSNDGGVNWRGMDADGNILANVLNAIGINAGWVRAGMLRSANNSTWINLNNGTFSFGDGAFSSGGIDFAGTVDDFNYIQTRYRLYQGSLSPMNVHLISSGDDKEAKLQANGLFFGKVGNSDAYSQYTHDLCYVDGQGLFKEELFAEKGLYVTGTKNRVVDTLNYGKVLLNAYETPRPTFADTGHAQIGEDGLCYIDIDSVFLETIDHTHDYRHFLTKYGQGDIWIKESNTDYFIVEGTPGLNFDWKIEAVQRDYNTYNLEQFVGKGHEIEETDYVSLADEYLRENEKEMIPDE